MTRYFFVRYEPRHSPSSRSTVVSTHPLEWSRREAFAGRPVEVEWFSEIPRGEYAAHFAHLQIAAARSRYLVDVFPFETRIPVFGATRRGGEKSVARASVDLKGLALDLDVDTITATIAARLASSVPAPVERLGYPGDLVALARGGAERAVATLGSYRAAAPRIAEVLDGALGALNAGGERWPGVVDALRLAAEIESTIEPPAAWATPPGPIMPARAAESSVVSMLYEERIGLDPCPPTLPPGVVDMLGVEVGLSFEPALDAGPISVALSALGALANDDLVAAVVEALGARDPDVVREVVRDVEGGRLAEVREALDLLIARAGDPARARAGGLFPRLLNYLGEVGAATASSPRVPDPVEGMTIRFLVGAAVGEVDEIDVEGVDQSGVVNLVNGETFDASEWPHDVGAVAFRLPGGEWTSV